MALLWVSLIVFSGCMGVLMSQLTGLYEEHQRRRARFVQLTKYMLWRGVPRQLRKVHRSFQTVRLMKTFLKVYISGDASSSRTREHEVSELYEQVLRENTRARSLCLGLSHQIHFLSEAFRPSEESGSK